MNHVVITGGHGTLAQAIAAVFADARCEIYTPSRTEMDVSDPHAVNACLKSRPIDLLICAAGITRDAPLSRLSEEMWDDVITVNYHGAIHTIRTVLPRMIERKKGHIILLSSNSAKHPPIGQVAYASAKASLVGLTSDLAEAHGANGIRINAILPGFLETRMTESVSETRKREILADHTLGSFNTPSAVAKFIRTLHEDLPNTSGQIFQLDSRVG